MLRVKNAMEKVLTCLVRRIFEGITKDPLDNLNSVWYCTLAQGQMLRKHATLFDPRFWLAHGKDLPSRLDEASIFRRGTIISETKIVRCLKHINGDSTTYDLLCNLLACYFFLSSFSFYLFFSSFFAIFFVFRKKSDLLHLHDLIHQSFFFTDVKSIL